ncbi:MAG: uroporphyrinogen-III C-methyltransferase [Betaproteobacteria bacterium]|nr:uroporphyrinogen-III C-methyltransferase [Betaproteobacteria bacterium]
MTPDTPDSSENTGASAKSAESTPSSPPAGSEAPTPRPGSNMPAPEAPAAPPARASASTWNNPWFFVAVLALLLTGWQWLETRAQFSETRQELARRLSESDLAQHGNEQETKKAQEEVIALKVKLAAIEEQFAEAKNQQATLELLYQQLAKGREEWALAEIEQSIGLAVQQLQLAGNVQAAVMALQTADAHLANNHQPQFISLRKAINHDLGALQSLPTIDIPGASMRLERILSNIDALPLAVYARPGAPAKAEDAPPLAAAPEDKAPGFWSRFGGELWNELKGMVRIQRFDREEPPLLAPGQAFFLRENLKLRLLNARMALLMRDQNTWRTEIVAAHDWIARHFDTREASVQATLSNLQQLGSAEISIALPSLNGSLSALRSAKLAGARQ